MRAADAITKIDIVDDQRRPRESNEAFLVDESGISLDRRCGPSSIALEPPNTTIVPSDEIRYRSIRLYVHDRFGPGQGAVTSLRAAPVSASIEYNERLSPAPSGCPNTISLPRPDQPNGA